MTKIYLPYFILIISLISGGLSYVDTKNYVARYNMARQRLEKENLQLREEREWEIKSKKQKDAEEKDNGLGNSSTRSGFIKKIIREVWGKEHAKIAIAIATAESGLREDAKGWNCIYYNKQGKPYSTACKVKDRPRAWSVDCGVMQLNFKGLECPKESYDVNWNIEKAYEWKFKNGGWGHWSVFNNGKYKKFL